MRKSAFVSVLVGLACVGWGMDSVIPENTPDVKPLVLTAMGIREAAAVSPTEVRVVMGPSYTDQAMVARSWRIRSEEDAAYAYEKFVKPVSVEKVAEASNPKEFEVPAGYTAPGPAMHKGFPRTVLSLKLAEPLKAGCRYAVIAHGNETQVVTGARTAAEFVMGEGKPVPSQGAMDLAASVLGLRMVRSVGEGLLLVEAGAGYSEEGGNVLANWSVTVNGEKRAVTALGRRSQLDVYLPVGWPFRVFRVHEIFLNIGAPLKNGDKVVVEAAEAVTCGANRVAMEFSDATSFSLSLKVNQAGYVPGGVKSARLGCWLGSYPDSAAKGATKSEAGAFPSASEVFGGSTKSDAEIEVSALTFREEPEFEVREAVGNKVVFRGKAKQVGWWNQADGKVNHSGENVYALDFTEFRVPGRYYVAVAGVGRSLEFAIDEAVYQTPFETLSEGLFAQRCGIELKAPYSCWPRIACHTNGVVATTLKRHEHHEFGPFEKNRVMEEKPAELPKTLAAAWARPSLAAYFPMEGDSKNARAGSAMALAQVEGGKTVFRADGSVTGKPESQVYCSVLEKSGLRGKLEADPQKGFSIVFWMKREDVNGNKFFGEVMLASYLEEPRRSPEVGITANWGMLSMNGTGWKRIGDGQWHCYAVTVPACEGEGGERKVEASFYVDGEKIVGRPFDWREGVESMFFRLGTISGEGSEGCEFDELRVYDESLPESVVVALSERVPDKLPVVLHTFGGHHDAGDYNPRCHMDVAFTLMSAYELFPAKFYDGQLNIPEKGNGIPDVVDEALWALRVWHGLYNPETGAVYNGTEASGDPNFYQTAELDNKGDYAWAPDSQGAFTYAAACAQASRLLRGVKGREAAAERLLERGRKAFAWGVENKPRIADVRTFGRFYTCPLAHAAVELYHTTGEAQYREAFRANSPWTANPKAEIIDSYGAYNMANAAYSYLLLPETLADKATWEAILVATRREADMYVEGSDKMAYKFIRHPYAPCTWGTGSQPNYVMPILVLASVEPEAAKRETYRTWLQYTADNQLGVNPMGMTWSVELGPRSVRAPLHNSRYSAKGSPAKGQQAQGPSQRGEGYNFIPTLYPKFSESHAVLRSFADCSFAIAMDEGTVPNQAKAVALFGALLPDAKAAKTTK